MRACPECGTVAVPTDKRRDRRRVWGCGNGYCGVEWITFKGQRIVCERKPWLEFPGDEGGGAAPD